MKKKIIIAALAIGLVFTGAAAGYAANTYFNVDSTLNGYIKQVDDFVKKHRQTAKEEYVNERENELKTEAENYFEESKQRWIETHGGVNKEEKEKIDQEYDTTINGFKSNLDTLWDMYKSE